METPENIPSDNKPKKKNRFFRFLKRLFLFVFISIIVFLAAAATIGYVYQDEVKEYVIAELNKQLNTEIIVDGNDIDFTVIKNFPYASVDFKNVKALDALKTTPKDTLFKADVISLQFNLLDIFKKNYKIKKIRLEDVMLHVKVDKQGNDNYHFWKESSDSTSGSFAFALEKIEAHKIQLKYNNKQSKTYSDFTINKGEFSGNFSEKTYSLNVDCKTFVEYIKTDSSSFLRKRNVSINSIVNIDNTINSYKFDKTKIAIESMLFELQGSVIEAENTPILNLSVKGKDMDIQSLLSLIPAKYKGKINDYESEGEFYFDATIKGEFSKNKSPRIIAEFGINNADITQIKDNIQLKRVNLKGVFLTENKSDKKPSQLILKSFSAAIEQGNISGNLNVSNLNKPSFDGNLKANLQLSEVQKFFKIDTIETIAGNLKVDVAFSGESSALESKKYENIQTTGSLVFSDVAMRIKNNNLDFNSINADFDFSNNDLKINQFAGNVSSSDFQLNGYIRNIVGYIIKPDEDITIDATLVSKKINLNELIANKEEEKNSKYKLKFSEHIDANLKINVEKIEFRKFEATAVYGSVKLKDKKMILDPINLCTMNGLINTSGYIDATDSTKVLITCFSDVNKINITKMFESFENFNQTAITAKNIKGTTTAKIQFASVFSPELKMDYDKVYAAADITIENGELNNVESMKSLSRFIELSELENIKFATLKNQIEIKNQVISIPKMEVKSSALNVYVSGTHTFKNEINYKVKLSLNELLSKKAKKAKKENEEFGEIADDGLGRTNIFLSMTGTVDNPVIKYDSKSAIQNVKQDLKVEKQNLKTILKEEFGLFKKDSTLGNKKKEEDTKFTIKWEEADKKEEPKKELKKPKKQEEEDF
jgi:hypothetical protein